MKNSLKTKALILVFIILSVVLGANTAFLSLQFASFEKTSLQNNAKLLGQHLRDDVTRALALGLPLDGLEGVNEACRKITDGNREIGYCMVTGRDSRILYHNDPLLSGMFLKDRASLRASASRQPLVQSREDHGEGYYDISLPVFDPEQKLTGAVRLGLRASALDEKIYPMVWNSAAIGILTFIIAAVIVTFLINRKLLTPLIEMSGTAQLIALGDWSRRLNYKSTNEVGQLAESFNRMAESLKDREDRIQQNYKDLEKANDDLQNSYARLETTAGELELKSQNLNEKVGELSFLHDATDRLRLSIELDEVLHSIARDVTEGLGYERVLVGLVDDDGKAIEERISFGMGGAARELLMEPLDTENIFAAAIKERAIQYVPQASMDMKVPPTLVEQLDLGEFAVIPMTGKDRCVGALLVDNRRSMRPMRRDKLDILATFASTAAMTVENAYLYRQLIGNLETVERANLELTKLDQTKTNFLSLASHELRTPLVSVMGYLNLMLSGDLGDVSREQRDMLEIAVKGANRLKDIIEDLLMVAKIEGGHLPLRLRWASFADVVEASLDEVRPFLKQRKVQITVEGLGQLPKVEADFDRMQQCMTNLISNGVKFTPDGGRVVVRGRMTRINRETGMLEQALDDSSFSADNYLEICVEDSGIGIKKENIEKIFDRFYEAGDVDSHSTGKMKFMGGGTGLGLSIAKGIVEGHSGRIWAESGGEDFEKCPGSRFFIIIPIKQPEEKVEIPLINARKAARVEAPARQRNPHKPKVLLVEDDEDTIFFTRLVLEKKFEVVIARDGFEGLKKAFSEKPEAILLDVWMRGMDGFQVCRILKTNEQTFGIPVAMFTAAAQKHEIARGMEAGAQDYITKPFTPSELVQRVEKLINAAMVI